MKPLISLALLLAASNSAAAQSTQLPAALAGGILTSVENTTLSTTGSGWQLAPKVPGQPIELVFSSCQALGVEQDKGQWWLLPVSAPGARIEVHGALWVLPQAATSKDASWRLLPESGSLHATCTASGLQVTLQAGRTTLTPAEARPHSDPFGNRFRLEMAGGAELEQALAGFYWGTVLPSVVERTMAASFPYSSGYVLSTLNIQSYAGSYPAVDHEFQIKGRLALGSAVDQDVVRRMIELQFQLMEDDPEHLFRAPCAVQPDGRREYHVRRDSLDRRENAAMFPLTGNIEVLEEAWLYFGASKDVAWLRSNIQHLEQAAGWVLASMDTYGRLWSDVYYEDQVIKDGRETQAQAFAAHNFELLAKLETRLGRSPQATRYAQAARKLAQSLVAPLPMGYWDQKNQRFVDWVDRNGQAHDHLHLVANQAPVLFGYATTAQASAVRRLLEQNDSEFERFPSFVAADIAAYNRSEQGVAGPYDLSAAGRYWFWDAAFRHAGRQNALLKNQLATVAAEGVRENYLMGERYDMDHVYYIDGKNAHGAEKYYEYPNVYAAVLITDYLGLSTPADADVAVAPRLASYGTAEFTTHLYALSYTWTEQGFVLKNLAPRPRRFLVDLSALGAAGFRPASGPSASSSNTISPGTRFTITLPGTGEARWIPVR